MNEPHDTDHHVGMTVVPTKKKRKFRLFRRKKKKQVTSALSNKSPASDVHSGAMIAKPPEPRKQAKRPFIIKVKMKKDKKRPRTEQRRRERDADCDDLSWGTAILLFLCCGCNPILYYLVKGLIFWSLSWLGSILLFLCCGCNPIIYYMVKGIFNWCKSLDQPRREEPTYYATTSTTALVVADAIVSSLIIVGTTFIVLACLLPLIWAIAHSLHGSYARHGNEVDWTMNV